MNKQNVLIIAAHPDDEILGCGATISKLSRLGANIFVCVLSNGESSRIKPEITKRIDNFHSVMSFFNIKNFKILNFPDSQFDSIPLLSIVQALEEIKSSFDPDIIFTHGSYDLNIDHQVAHKATLTAFRPTPNARLNSIYTYEVLSTTETAQSLSSSSNFIPNHFIEVSEIDVQNKLKALSLYESEVRQAPHPRSTRSVEALLTFRGTSVGVMNAEAFFCERSINRI